ncbi:MAG: S16 family serine protease, partial [Acidimicrobiia bacterium]
PLLLVSPPTSLHIPAPRLQRVEVIRLPGYTEDEKMNIAKKYLVPKQMENNGLKAGELVVADEVLLDIVRHYTREAGVRNLEREVGAICRNIARRRAEGDDDRVKVTPEFVHELLGAPRFMDEEVKDRTRNPGVATGMAWTPVGGDVLFVEASRMAGGGSLTLTGQLGDVRKESARAALSWVRAHATEWQIDPEFFKSSELHVHVPSGAIPKDGPSAGVTMVTAMVSELTRRPVRSDLSMTGEITLQGKVLPVGGIKEKVLAARRAGIREVILPKQNEKNVKEDLGEELRKGLTIHLVSTIDEVLLLALVQQNDRPSRKTGDKVKSKSAPAARSAHRAR